MNTSNPNAKPKNKQINKEDIIKAFNERQEKQKAAQHLYLDVLPIQPLMITYEQHKQGDWELVADSKSVPTACYFGTIMFAPDYRLQKVRGADAGVWMSITPMELQSATIHLSTLIDVARSAWENDGKVAHIVIGGFGMGMFLINALYHLEHHFIPAKITVIELSKDIPEIIKAASNGLAKQLLDDSLSGENEISLEIIHDDLLKMQPLDDVDYMFVDIWQFLGSNLAREQSRELKQKWMPKTYGYWGEEIDIAVYGQDLIDELNLSVYYKDERIIEACDVIFEAKVGIPVALAKKKLGAIGEDAHEDAHED